MIHQGRVIQNKLVSSQKNIMEAMFKLKADDFDQNLLKSIKQLFHGREIVIKITTEIDDTAFLSFYTSNEQHILKNMVAEPSAKFSGDEFKEFISNLP